MEATEMFIGRQMDKKVWYIYTMEYYSAIKKKKECIWVSSNEVDETGAYYTEWNKLEREK